MKRIILLGCCSLSLVAFADEATVFHDTQGNVVAMDAFKQKWVVLTYWSTWCTTCHKEIPELNRFYQQHHQNVVFYGVNYDQPELGELKEAMVKENIAFPVLIEDPNRQAWQLGDIEWLPITFIINPEGQIVKKIVGKNSAESLSAILAELQNAKSISAV